MAKRHFLFSILVFLGCGIFAINPVGAAEPAFVALDSQTLQKGFTLKSSDNNFWLGILPNYFQNQLKCPFWVPSFF